MQKHASIVMITGLAIVLGMAGAAVSKPAVKTAAKAAIPAGPAATKFGALAVDRAKGFAYGFAFDHPSRTAAAQFALAECTKRNGNCSVVVEFAGPGCAAYRTVDARAGTAYGWGTAATQAAAEARASAECGSFAGGQVCSNNVWACNSNEPAAFKVLRSDPVKRAKSPKDCLIQYELQVDDSGDNWKTRIYSPVYRLAPSDCPLAGNSEYHGFHHNVWDGKVSAGESNESTAPKNPALRAKGLAMAGEFYGWFSTRRAPWSGLHFRPSAGLTSSIATDKIAAELLDNVGGHDTGDSASIGDGVCIAYAPPGIAPIETLGDERCRRWVK